MLDFKRNNIEKKYSLTLEQQLDYAFKVSLIGKIVIMSLIYNTYKTYI